MVNLLATMVHQMMDMTRAVIMVLDAVTALAMSMALASMANLVVSMVHQVMDMARAVIMVLPATSVTMNMDTPPKVNTNLKDTNAEDLNFKVDMNLAMTTALGMNTLHKRATDDRTTANIRKANTASVVMRTGVTGTDRRV
jgi:hypothetical protein